MGITLNPLQYISKGNHSDFEQTLNCRCPSGWSHQAPESEQKLKTTAPGSTSGAAGAVCAWGYSFLPPSCRAELNAHTARELLEPGFGLHIWDNLLEGF